MIYLASQSRIRQHLLAQAGVSFQAVSSNFQEDVEHDQRKPTTEPSAYAIAMATQKAIHVKPAHNSDVIIGADQTLSFEGKIIHKCTTTNDARQLLQKLRGKTHHLHAAVSIAIDGKQHFQHCETVTLTMRNFSDRFLDRYLETIGPDILASVGCYHFEGRGIQLFENVQGSYHAILGLPLLPLLAFLREIGELDQ